MTGNHYKKLPYKGTYLYRCLTGKMLEMTKDSYVTLTTFLSILDTTTLCIRISSNRRRVNVSSDDSKVIWTMALYNTTNSLLRWVYKGGNGLFIDCFDSIPRGQRG